MKTITFYAYKGGTGRSLVVANVARYLARFGQKVFVVDFDFEAPGLHYKLSNSEEPLEINKGVVDFFHTYEESKEFPASLADFHVSVPLGAGVSGSVDLMPAGAVPTPHYWRKLASLNWKELFYQPGAIGVAMFLELKERIRSEIKPDFLLFDARTGITEVGGIATTLLSDTVVCLLANNRENLDGVRVVLRSIQRSTRSAERAPVELIAVVTRIPKQDDANEEDAICESIRNFLTAPAENLEDTLNISDIFVLHSEPKLQIRERVLVGSEDTKSASILLRDYLRLFARLIPRDILRPYMDKLVKDAKAAIFEDPDAAQKEMESLASYFGHPDIYRELLKFYRARNISGYAVLDTANALWQASNDANDPVLWSAIQANIGSIYHWDYSKLPVQVIEAVWIAHGASEPKVGRRIAELHSGKNRFGSAANILEQLIGSGDTNDETFAAYLEQLRKAKRWEKAVDILKYLSRFKVVPIKTLRQWAILIVERPELFSEFALGDASLTRLKEDSPVLGFRVYQALGNSESANRVLDDALIKALKEGSSHELENMAEQLDELGRFDDFENAMKRQWPVDDAEDFLSHFRRETRRRMR